MRTTLLAVALGGALLLAPGCGAKVAVDLSSSGAGGGSGGSTGSGGAGSTSTGALTCDFACGGPIGLCGCAGPCSDGKMRAIGCGATPTGVSCGCVVDGMTVGTCASPVLACQLTGSCCGAIFGE
jgi:hypothetical protein